MDTSSEYILMCEKAEEIQALREIGKLFVDGDWWMSRRWNDGVPCVWRAYRGIDEVWLPRQDQLQEMAWSHIAGTYNLLPTKLFAFSDYWEENGIPHMFTSMEQLWLAFYQKEKFGKVWQNGEWVKSA